MFRVFSAVGKAVGELQHCNSRNIFLFFSFDCSQKP